MTIFVENETDYVFPFDPEKVAGQVVLEVLEEESCPYETEVNILITDNEGIRLYNGNTEILTGKRTCCPSQRPL